MHLLVDSTGIKLSETGDWLSKNHQINKRQQLLKLNIAVDAEDFLYKVLSSLIVVRLILKRFQYLDKSS